MAISDWRIFNKIEDYIWGLQLLSGPLSMLLGLIALIQKSINYRCLWWLALVGMFIGLVLIILNVIGFVLVFTMLPK